MSRPLFYKPKFNELHLGDCLAALDNPAVIAVGAHAEGFVIYRAENWIAANALHDIREALLAAAAREQE